MSTSLVIAPADMPVIARDRIARGDRYLADPSRKLYAVLGEEAIRRVIGSPAVLVAQLDRLLELSTLPNVTIQVVPLTAGGHAALEYTFTLLYIARARARIVYLESLTTADYLARPQHTQTYSLAFASAKRAALSAEASTALIQQVKQELEGAAHG